MPKRNAVIIAAVVGIMLVGTLVGFYMEHRRWEERRYGYYAYPRY